VGAPPWAERWPRSGLERRAYLGAIRDALAGVEGARVVLAKARHRLERERGL
jgi:hypothetical protein